MVQTTTSAQTVQSAFRHKLGLRMQAYTKTLCTVVYLESCIEALVKKITNQRIKGRILKSIHLSRPRLVDVYLVEWVFLRNRGRRARA
jgi:hypothetical protein